MKKNIIIINIIKKTEKNKIFILLFFIIKILYNFIKLITILLRHGFFVFYCNFACFLDQGEFLF
jgi:hypothetical protein